MTENPAQNALPTEPEMANLRSMLAGVGPEITTSTPTRLAVTVRLTDGITIDLESGDGTSVTQVTITDDRDALHAGAKPDSGSISFALTDIDATFLIRVMQNVNAATVDADAKRIDAEIARKYGKA